jgi:exosortase/archaeosortase family protein
LSTSTVSALRLAQDWTAELQARWEGTTASVRLWTRVGVLVGVTLAAYHYTLSSLLQTINFDTPLAYLGLVPVIAGALGYALGRAGGPEPAIHDRQLDYIIGVPLIAIAWAINEFLPSSQSVLFWVRRMDLVSLPFFVAGAVAILFGTRVLWRQKVAICYLFLAWPWPYTTFLLGTLNGFTSLTVSGLTAALRIVHLGAPVHAADGETGLFQIVHHGQAFPVSVATACSGVDGMVGFFLVGAALLAIVHGPWLRKALWLAVGLVLLWATNLGRLLLIFWAGKNWGEHVALKILHPIAGLIIFNIGVVFMLLLLRPFGLRLGRVNPGTPTAKRAPRSPKNSGQKAQPVFAATALVAVVGAVLMVNNTSLKSFDIVAGASGDARLPSFLVDPAAPAGWAPIFTTEYIQNKSLFGNSSRWFRYTYFDRGGGDLSATVPVIADVINANGFRGFGAYGVEACYDFHGYSLRDLARVSLGGGITGEALSYSTPTDGDWSIVYWVWPVKTGTQTRYERIILYVINTIYGRVTPTQSVASITGLKGALGGGSSVDKRLLTNRQFLVAFAREIIRGQAHITESATPIGQVLPPSPPPLSHSELMSRPGARAWHAPAWLVRLRQQQAANQARIGHGR